MGRKRAKSLSDLGETTVEIEVARPDGEVVIVALRSLSQERMRQLRASVEWPTPPVKDFGPKGMPIYDYENKDYKRADAEADALLSYRALLAALLLDIPGETDDERLAALRDGLGAYAFGVLVTAVMQMNVIGPEEVAAVARSFRSRRTGGASGNGAAEPDSQPMAEPAA